MPKLWAKGCSEAHQYACEQLSTAGFSILQAPGKTIDGVLLDVPSFRGTDLADIAWEELPENAIVIGGNLAKHVPDRFRSIDLLRDPEFTAQNADITSLVFNTAPSLLLSREMTARCPDCLLIDLASQPGMQGDDVLWARGLPGKMAPESSGKLIAETILRLWKENGF